MTSTKLSGKTGSITCLDTFPIVETDSNGFLDHKVLAVHQDGTVACYSKDLSIEHWNTQSASLQHSNSNFKIEYASIVNREETRQSLLKSREDILFPLGTAEEDYDGSFLLTISRHTSKNEGNNKGSLVLNIFDIDSTAIAFTGLSLQSKGRLKPLASVMIPEPPRFQSKTSTIAFHVASGTMYQNIEGALAIYEFIGLVPRLAHELSLSQDTNSSYLRISANLLARADSESLTFVNLPYLSIQAESSLDKARRPQKRIHGAAKKSNFQLLSCFARQDIVIALDGRKLVAIQLPSAAETTAESRKRTRDGLLVNSLGRSSLIVAKTGSNREPSDREIRSLGTYINTSSAQAKWDQQKVELNVYASQNDHEGFESIAVSLLGVGTQAGNKSKLPSADHAHVDIQGVHEILGMMFCVTEDEHQGLNGILEPQDLKIRFLPLKICNWLMEMGVLTVANIEKSLKRSRALPITAKLATGTLIRAFAGWDSSLELLSTLLASPVPLSSGELVHVLAIVIRESNATQSSESLYRLTNGNGSDSVNDTQMELTNGETSQTPPSTTQSSLHENHRHLILTNTMKKLYNIPSSTITRSLRTELSTTQLRLLIDTLRIETRQNGWLSPYEDNLSTLNQPPSPPSNHQISHIAHLLNCTIDSIGTGGWMLSGTSTTNDDLADSADMITWMKAEISAALEGIEEATYVKGILGEMLLCGKDTLRSSQHVKALKNDEQQDSMTVAAVRPVTVALEEVSHMLPLGLSMAQGTVSSTVVKAGGEVRLRRKRDIGRLKSRMVGKYSYERIVI